MHAQQRRYKKSEASKRAILHAAHKLIVEKGFQKTSIKEIVQESGLSVGSFYHHFKNKDDLLNEAFHEFDDQLNEETFARYDSMNALDAVKTVLIEQTKYTEAFGPKLMSEYYRALLQHENRGALNPKRTYYRAVKTYAEKAQRLGLLNNAYDSSTITEHLIKSVRGTLVDWRLHNGSYPVTEYVESELDFYLAPFLNSPSLCHASRTLSS